MADTPTQPNSSAPAKRAQAKQGESWTELAKTVIYAGLIAIVIRTFLFQPFNIPSASMEGTLLIGDYLFVSKYAYGYSRYSIPFGPPVFSGRIFGSQPKRGDIVVFKLPKDNSTDYIKRVVGLPGDRIAFRDQTLFVNGEPVAKRAAGVYVGTGFGREMTGATLYEVDLPGQPHGGPPVGVGPRREHHVRAELVDPAEKRFARGQSEQDAAGVLELPKG